MPLEEELLVAIVFLVHCQWPSSGLPMVSQCVPIMKINTGLPLGHHWLLASVRVLPVASKCFCGSRGLPDCSSYANDELWVATGRPLGDNIGQCGSSVVCPVVSQCTGIWFGGGLRFIQCCSSVGCNNSRSFSSGIPVWGIFIFPVTFLQVVTGLPNGITVYTGSTGGIPMAFQCTLDQPVYTGSG